MFLTNNCNLVAANHGNGRNLFDRHSHVLKFSTAAAHGMGVVISDVECQLRVLKFRTAAASRDRRKLTRLLTSPY